jgi:hypothetical protein
MFKHTVPPVGIYERKTQENLDGIKLVPATIQLVKDCLASAHFRF